MEDDRNMTGKEEKTSPARLRQAKEKRERIIAGAMELFWRNCVEDASMEEIAKCAGVGVATVYRYFQTKIELVIAAAEAYCFGGIFKATESVRCQRRGETVESVWNFNGYFPGTEAVFEVSTGI